MSSERHARDAEPPQASHRRGGEQPLLSVRNLKTHFPVNSGFISSVQFDSDGGLLSGLDDPIAREMRFDPDGGLLTGLYYSATKAVPFGLDDSSVKAVDGVDFDLYPGETLGVVGESGCGKSTLARTVLGLEEPTAGEVEFDGTPMEEFGDYEWTDFRRNAQIVFQDPQSSLNPRRKVGHIIADPLEAAGWDEAERRERAAELLEQVGLSPEHFGRYPHEFSGGQRQRINLARALSINPDLIVADEPVSGLDMSVQAQILELMADLQEEYGLTYLLITHDLSVVRHICDRVAVMYLGEFVETAPTEELFTRPHHPYTRALLDAVPNPNPDAAGVTAQVEGDVPSPTDPPSGCRFHTRCPKLIPPEGFTREAYRGFMAFREDVTTGDLDFEGNPDDALGEYVADTVGVPAAAREAAREAASRAQEGEYEAARDALAGFASVCERDAPPLETIGTDHRSACHLPADERAEYEW
jgi:peptide/nickel transport system ATP-binding protein